MSTPPVQLLANNTFSTLNGAILVGATSIVVQTADAALFPNPTGGDWFLATLTDRLGNLEHIKCTARSSATLTVERAQEGTTAFAFASGSRIDMRLTKGTLARYAFGANATVVDNALTRWDGAGGQSLQSSPVIVDDAGNVTGVASLLLTGTSTPTPTNDGLLQWDNDDNALAAGTGSGTVLFRANDWEKIYVQTFAGSAFINFINLSAFRELRIAYTIDATTDSAGMWLRYSTDNGTTALAGATEYNNYSTVNNGSTIAAASSSTTAIQLDANLGVSNSPIGGIRGNIHIFDFNKAVVTRFVGHAWLRIGGVDTKGRLISIGGDGTSIVAKNALRFLPGSGIISCSVVIEGLRG